MRVLATMQNLKKYQDVKGVVMYSPDTSEQYSATLGDYFMTPPDHKFIDSEGNQMYLVIPGASHVDIVNADLSAIIDLARKPDGTAERSYLRELWDGESWASIKKKLDTEGSAWVVWYQDGLSAHTRKQKIKPPKKYFYEPKVKTKSGKKSGRSKSRSSSPTLGSMR